MLLEYKDELSLPLPPARGDLSILVGRGNLL